MLINVEGMSQLLMDVFGPRASFGISPQPIGTVFSITVYSNRIPDGHITKAWLHPYAATGRCTSADFFNEFRRHVRWLRNFIDSATAPTFEQSAIYMAFDSADGADETAAGAFGPPTSKVVDFKAASQRIKSKINQPIEDK